MGVLHLVSRSPYTSLTLTQCLARLEHGDALLLLASAVYGACRENPAADSIQASHAACYALVPDLQIRGIPLTSVLPQITLVDFDGFVDLTVAYTRILSW